MFVRTLKKEKVQINLVSNTRENDTRLKNVSLHEFEVIGVYFDHSKLLNVVDSFIFVGKTRYSFVLPGIKNESGMGS